MAHTHTHTRARTHTHTHTHTHPRSKKKKKKKKKGADIGDNKEGELPSSWKSLVDQCRCLCAVQTTSTWRKQLLVAIV